MAKFMSVIISTAAAAVMMIGGTHVYAEENASLLVMGDSITGGYGLKGYASAGSDGAKDSFANLLSGEFESFLNLSENGRTSGELLEEVKSDSRCRTAAAEADVIVISAGGNDLLSPVIDAYKGAAESAPDHMYDLFSSEDDPLEIADRARNAVIQMTEGAVKSVDINKTVSNISEITEEFLKLNPTAQIYILTVYDPFAGNDLTGDIVDITETALAQLNGGITEIANGSSNVHVVDVYEAFKGKEKEYTNISLLDIHPNKNGHRKIYSMLYEDIFGKEPGQEQNSRPEKGVRIRVRINGKEITCAEDLEEEILKRIM